ncbi:hypothetical protein HYT26_04770 [Candidatus Pacearchaeota archaeon]|nr:hypothetical protein [Candidatus Pacearchaeota archaeon]
MDKIIDMKFMRYLNLFERVSRVSTKNCSMYNSNIIFFVEQRDVPKAIGEDGRNIRRIGEILNKKVRVVALPAEKRDMPRFIEAIIYPVKFRGIEINDSEIIINAGRLSKASLIGRNRARLDELQKIAKEYLNKSVKIV